MISLYLPGHFYLGCIFVTGLGFVKIKKEHRLEFLEFGKGLKKSLSIRYSVLDTTRTNPIWLTLNFFVFMAM